MATIVALLFARGRRTSPCILLATVAFCLLLCNPLALFQPSFQLSFLGVAGTLIWLPHWQRKTVDYGKLVRWPLTLVMCLRKKSRYPYERKIKRLELIYATDFRK